MKNIFKLKTEELKEIASSFQAKVETGLNEDNTEIQCLPTYITPKADIKNGKALVLDLGGTNYRAAIVDFVDGVPVIHPENGWKKDLSVMKTPGFTREQLYKEIADLISELNLDEEMPIGYCFSYPAESMPDGDARLLRWTKGVNIAEMIGEPIGQPLLEYLNKNISRAKFTGIKVINDTVASLFAGLTEPGYDAYIGLIVGTGTNTATFVRSEDIKKLAPEYRQNGLLPVNLESGNFHPQYLTVIDQKVDAASAIRGAQRFEKAVSGMYLGEILKFVFSCDEFEEKFDAQKLTHIMNYSDMYKDKYVCTARQIYKRSALLVAASLAGLIQNLLAHNPTIARVQLTAEGSLFWSKDRKGKDYKNLVLDELHVLLSEAGYSDVRVHITQKDNANLIGSAIAALS